MTDFFNIRALSELFLALFEHNQSTVPKYNSDCYLSLNPPREMGDSHSKYIRTVSSSACHLLLLSWFLNHFGRATWTISWVLLQTLQSKQMQGWVLRMTWGLEAYFTVFHSEPVSALACWQYGHSGETQGWLGVRERVIWSVWYIQQLKALFLQHLAIPGFSQSSHTVSKLSADAGSLWTTAN